MQPSISYKIRKDEKKNRQRIIKEPVKTPECQQKQCNNAKGLIPKRAQANLTLP